MCTFIDAKMQQMWYFLLTIAFQDTSVGRNYIKDFTATKTAVKFIVFEFAKILCHD